MRRHWPPALYISDTACPMRIVEIVLEHWPAPSAPSDWGVLVFILPGM